MAGSMSVVNETGSLERTDSSSISRILQHSILQLCNEHIQYSHKLQILGVLCMTVDDEKQELVVKVNNTLKRVSPALTPGDSQDSPQPIQGSSHYDVYADIHDRMYDDGNIEDDHEHLLMKNHSEAYSAYNKARSGKRAKRKSRKKVSPSKVLSQGCEYDEDTRYEAPRGDSSMRGVDQYGSVSNSPVFFTGPPSGDSPSSNLTFDQNESGSESDLHFPMFTAEGLNDTTSRSHLDYTSFLKNAISNNSSLESICSNSGLLDAAAKNFEEQSFGELRDGLGMKTSTPFETYKEKIDKTKKDGIYSQSFQSSPEKERNNSKIKDIIFYDSNSPIATQKGNHIETDYMLDQLCLEGRKRRRRSPDDSLTAEEIAEYMGKTGDFNVLFKCRFCSTEVNDLAKYLNHTLTTHNAYICHQCGKSFTTKSSLLRHRPIHTGMRRFACTLCRKTFYRKDKCKAHIKRHLGVVSENSGDKSDMTEGCD